MPEGTTLAGKMGTRLNEAVQELDAMYDNFRDDPDADVGERLLELEEMVVSQPAGSLDDIIARTRGLILIGDVSRGVDEPLFIGLRTLLDDLNRLGRVISASEKNAA